MENWYRFYKAQANEQFKFGDYEIKYVKKEVKEDFNPKGDKVPSNVNKEQLKVFKAGQKVKVRKADKLALIEAIKAGNVDRMNEILLALKS
ncbi:MAG: hypothetical protein M1441_01440 [Candidatus Parvarchaeota archaeon]|jgi:hypothetical protein|nr:hypothetical protein [Candidatus Parvarchaeota archaeon]